MTTTIVRTPLSHPLNTILRDDNPDLERVLNQFLSESERIESGAFRPAEDIEIPASFDGKSVWSKYLSPIKDQDTCGGCYAYAATSALADRFNLRTAGALRLDLSASRIILCDLIGQSARAEAQRQAEIGTGVQELFGCFGNSLLEAWRYLYNIGTNTTRCFPEGAGQTCEQVVGPFYDTCVDGETPAVFYRASDVYLVPSLSEDGGSELTMRQDIFRFGPLTTALYVYENFYTFDPTKEMYRPSGERVGGHAVVIDGWGVENGVKFWWVRNSWGSKWGIGGYFKIERGVNMCDCEENVIAGMPDVGDVEMEGGLFRNTPVERVGLLVRSQATFFGGLDPDAMISRRHMAYEERAVAEPEWRQTSVVEASQFVAGQVWAPAHPFRLILAGLLLVCLLIIMSLLNRVNLKVY